MPSPGKITHLEQPSGPGIRLDSGVYAGWTVPLDYDPMLAKIAAWAPSREAAIRRMRRALSEYVVEGIRTNLAWFDEILADESFRAGDLSTAFLENFQRKPRSVPDDRDGSRRGVGRGDVASRSRPPCTIAPQKRLARRRTPGDDAMKLDVMVDGRTARLDLENGRFRYQREGEESVEREFSAVPLTPGA